MTWPRCGTPLSPKREAPLLRGLQVARMFHYALKRRMKMYRGDADHLAICQNQAFSIRDPLRYRDSKSSNFSDKARAMNSFRDIPSRSAIAAASIRVERGKRSGKIVNGALGSDCIGLSPATGKIVGQSLVKI